MLIDVAIPGDRNVIMKETEKILKYKDLLKEIQRMWNVKANVIPLITGATGTISKSLRQYLRHVPGKHEINPLNTELNSICYMLALLGAHHFFHVSRIRVKLLTFRLLMSYIYGAPILDVSRSHTTTQHSR